MSTSPESERGVWMRNGRLYLDRNAYEQYLSPCTAVGLLAQDGIWLLLPLHGGAGGLQVKLRNARGDRVIEAQEFFRTQGYEDTPELRVMQLQEESRFGGFRVALAKMQPS